MNPIRRSVERFSRGKTFWRKLPRPFSQAHILVTPDAALSLMKPGSAWADAELLLVVSQYVNAGDVVWDIGANVGILAAASAVRSGAKGAVLCIEPDIFLAGMLRRTAAKLSSDCAKVNVLPVAISATSGVATFYIAERGRASNALAEAGGRSQMGGVRESILVPTTSLDSLLDISRPQFIKIDVEGAEEIVLSGASKVLNEVRPIIHIEVGKAHTAEVTDRFHAASYRLFDPKMPVREQKPLSQCIHNTLAMPAEKVA
jgi:FkbM family methyltransferase